MTENRAHLLALAGLLHDIGKFAVRAGEGGSRIWDAEAQRDYGYKHALLTADFVERYVPALWQTEIKLLAGNHHRPQREDDKIIRHADHLSAGERDNQSDDTDAKRTHPRQLLSIFCDLRSDEQTTAENLYLPLLPLDAALREPLTEDRAPVLFPSSAEPNSDLVWQRYRALWDAFCLEAGRLRDTQQQDADLPTYVAGMLLLMQRFLWCIPSAYYGARPDISLYDHSRTAGALAAVLPAADGANDATAALLVGGDMSGVQDFLYTITARGATAALRGRSYFLQMLTEAIARFLLRTLDLPLTNLIYVGGGNFYLLARPQDKDALAAAQRYLSTILYHQYKGDLYVALAAEPLRNNDFAGERIGLAWARLHEQFQRNKRRRFSELDNQIFEVFEPGGLGGSELQQCQVCGMEHPSTQSIKSHAGDADEESVRKCPACLSYEQLGDDLRRARFLVLDELQLPTRAEAITSLKVPGSHDVVLAGLGLRMSVHDSMPAAARSGQVERRTLLALSPDWLAEMRPGPRTAVGLRLLVNVTPIQTDRERCEMIEQSALDDRDISRPGQIKTFSELAVQSQGIVRLGLLRMDVDNAGALFARGFEMGGKSIASLSRIAALSFALDVYFSGWVARLAELQTATDGVDRLYSIYAGGDDLFFVGSWDAVVRLAQSVRSDLTRYAANHPGIHASAGLQLVDMKYPLALAAREAGEAEELAKRLRWWDGDIERHKDAFTFLGKPLPWVRFGLAPHEDPNTRTAQGIVNLLSRLAADKAAMPVVRRLAELSVQYEEAEEQRRMQGDETYQNGRPRPLWGPYMWRAVYALSRVAGDALPGSVKQLRDQLQADQFTSIEWIGLAARWAELKLR